MAKASKLLHFVDRRKNLKKEVEKIIREELDIARQKTIDVVAEATPHKFNEDGSLFGNLANSWAKDSDKKVSKSDKEFKFKIKSKVPYAIYVNNGHSLTQHYVPGLFIDEESGKLIYDKDLKDEVGITVGTQTSWVEGAFMLEKGERFFKKYIREDFKKKVAKKIKEIKL